MRSDSLHLRNSIALITGKSSNTENFGTGFAIYVDNQQFESYWLTCAHVLEAIEGEEIRVDSLPAILVSPSLTELNSPEVRGIDLAVLKVRGLLDRTPLQMSKGKLHENVCIVGYYNRYNSSRSNPSAEPLKGRVVNWNEGNIDGKRTLEWKLEVAQEATSSLQPGYSGAPVVSKENKVIGVMAARVGLGKAGFAISLEALFDPIFLRVPIIQTLVSCMYGIPMREQQRRVKEIESKIEENKRKMKLLEVRRLERATETRKQILKWMSSSLVAVQCVEYARSEIANLNDLLLNNSIISNADALEQLIWEVEKYIERIYAALLFKSRTFLDDVIVLPSLPIKVYAKAFEYLLSNIPGEIASSEEHTELEEYVGRLLLNLKNV